MESQASQRRVKPRAREVCAVEDLDKKSAEEKSPSGGKRGGPLLVQCYGCHECGHIRLDSPREPEGQTARRLQCFDFGAQAPQR